MKEETIKVENGYKKSTYLHSCPQCGSTNLIERWTELHTILLNDKDRNENYSMNGDYYILCGNCNAKFDEEEELKLVKI